MTGNFFILRRGFIYTYESRNESWCREVFNIPACRADLLFYSGVTVLFYCFSLPSNFCSFVDDNLKSLPLVP